MGLGIILVIVGLSQKTVARPYVPIEIAKCDC
jgi:hypothetical protein